MAHSPPNDSDPKKSDAGAASDQQPRGNARARGRRGRRTHGARRLAALQAEATDFKDKWLRAHAEIENIRKRSEREREETAKYAVTRLARDIVTVGDNLQRAISAVPADAAESDPPSRASWKA